MIQFMKQKNTPQSIFPADKYDEATDNLLEWINSGQLQVLKDELDGLEKAPQGFVDLLAGGNIGTRIVNI